MNKIEAMKLDPNTTLESFEAAIREDEREIIKVEHSKEMKEHVIVCSILSAIAASGAALLCVNLL